MNMKTRNLTGLLAAVLIASFSALQAQDRKEIIEISGVVKDNEGEPVAGASVHEVGSKNGVITGYDGDYKISVHKGKLVRVSFLGFETYDFTASSPKVNIVLKPESTQLDQVVVTGYANVEMRKSTGAVAVVKMEEMKDNPLKQVDQMLQGQLAGVSVQNTSGRPGESAKIRIRGTNTITGNAEPLWVVDGVPLQKNLPDIQSSQIKAGDFDNIFATGIASINPNDIESITVLKDAAAAAIYGSQAASGVIVVTTKSGKAGRTSVGYMGSVTVQTRPQRDANLMNSQEKLAWEQELWDEFSAAGFAATQAGTSTHYPVIGIVGQIRSGYGQYAGMSTDEQNALIASLGENTTDWFDVLFRNTVSTAHHLSVSGGPSQKLTYYVSGGFNFNNGLVINTGANSYNLSAKVNSKPLDWLKFGVQTDFSYNKSYAPSNNVNMFKYAYFANPYEALYNSDGSYRADRTYFTLGPANGSYTQSLPENGFNIMREINETSSKATSSSTNIRGDLTINIAKGLTFNGLASFSYSSDYSENINGKETYAAWNDRPFENNTITSKRTYGSITQTQSVNTSYLVRGQLNYEHTFLKAHSINAIAGAEIRKSKSTSIFTKRYGYDPVTGNNSTPLFTSPDGISIDYEKLTSFGNILDGCSGQSIIEDAFASFYGTATYSALGRYIFSGTLRSDGSSNFGSNQQFNLNWSVSGAWNIDEEKWMQPLQPVLSSLSLKAGFGYTGGVNKTVYPVLIMNYLSSYRNTETDFYRQGVINNPPNPNLRWEKNRTLNVGMSFGFLKDRITGELAYYQNKNIDLVTRVRVPTSTGFSTQSYNTSEQMNQGVELTLGATLLKIKDFNWRITANAAYNQNRLTKYESPTGSIYGDYYVGYPLGKIFTGKTTGINPEVGLYDFQLRPDIEIRDITDYQQYQNYLFYVGTSNAPWSGGFSTTFSWKGLSLNIVGNFSAGAKVLNDITCPVSYSSLDKNVNEPVQSSRSDLYVNHLNVNRNAAYRWTPANPVTDGYPRLVDAYGERLTDNSGNYLNRTRPYSSTLSGSIFLEDLSYLKFSSISISYALPKKWTDVMKMSGMSLSFLMNNLFTITNYSGLDPESPGAVYPQSRSFTFSLNINF